MHMQSCYTRPAPVDHGVGYTFEVMLQQAPTPSFSHPTDHALLRFGNRSRWRRSDLEKVLDTVLLLRIDDLAFPRLRGTFSRTLRLVLVDAHGYQ